MYRIFFFSEWSGMNVHVYVCKQDSLYLDLIKLLTLIGIVMSK